MNSNNIYNILGKLASLTPKEEPKQESLVKELHESIEAKGSVLEGVSAVEARLIREFNEGSTGDYSAKKARAGKDIGKPGKAFAKIAKSAGEKYGSKERGEKVAGAVLAKLRKEDQEVSEVAAPGQEDWIKSNKQHFIDQYGKDKGEQVLYATAWKRHHAKNEGVEEGQEICAECGSVHVMAEGEITRTASKTVHRKTDFPGYPTDDAEDDGEVRIVAKKGRPLKAQTKKPRVDPNAPKKGRGRPKADKPIEFSKLADPFGRISATAHKKAKGTKVKGASMSGSLEESMNKVSRSIVESINFKRMMDETSMGLEEMIESLNCDMKEYKLTGSMSDRLRDFMHIHQHAKKQMEETSIGNLPASQVPGKQALLKTPTSPLGKIGGAVKDTLGGIKDFVTGKPEDPTRPTYEEDLTLENELNELAKLAGLNVKEDPQAEFEGNAFTGKLKDTPKGGKFDLDGEVYTDTSELDEADAPVDEPNEELSNSPKKKYFSMKASTLAPGEGEFGEKAMHGDRPTWKNGDNPLTKPATNEATLKLEAKLAAEYESIKKVSK